MFKKSMATLTGVLVVFSLTAPAFADTQSTVNVNTTITQATQAIQAAQQAERTEEATYQALLKDAVSVLTTTASSSGNILSANAKQGINILQSDLVALSSATTVSQAKSALIKLQKDMEKVKELLGNQGGKHGDGGNEQQHSLKNVISESQKSTKKFVSDLEHQVSKIQSTITSLTKSTSTEQTKQLVNETRKLDKATSKLESKFAKWDNKIKLFLSRLSSGTQSTSTQQTNIPPTPPLPPSTNGSTGTSSTGSSSTPPAPPSAP